MQRHPPCFHFIREIVLHAVFGLEIPLIERYPIRSALRPDVAESIGTSEFQQRQVIRFTYLVPARIVLGRSHSVPAICDMLFRLTGFTVANAASPPAMILQHLIGRGWVDSTGGYSVDRARGTGVHADERGLFLRLWFQPGFKPQVAGSGPRSIFLRTRRPSFCSAP